MDELMTAELDELDQLNVVAHGEYSTKTWQLRDKLRARRKALIDADTDPAPPPAEPDEAVAGAQADAPDTPVDVAEADEPAAANTAAE
jgi:hypothetical protein